MNADEFIEHIKNIGVPGILEEYRLIRLEPPTSKFDVFK